MSRPFQRWILLIIISTVGLYYFLHLQSLDTSSGFSWTLFGDKSIIDWSRVNELYPLETFTTVPPPRPALIPKFQAKEFPETEAQKKLRLQRQSQVRDAFQRSWTAYKDNAWLHDEFSPITKAWKDHFGGWGATLVDSLDTLYIMGLEEEFLEAVDAISTINFSTTHVRILNVFESTIRFLGGLLAAHDISSEPNDGIILKKAKELGDMLYHAFDTENRMPMTRWAWQQTADGLPQDPHRYTLAAELASMSLEFTRLSQLTGDPKYFDAVQRVTNVLESEQKGTKLPGLWPVVFNAKTMSFRDDLTFTLGGRADSMYEYIAKEHILLGAANDQYQNMYNLFMDTAKQHLFFKPMNKNNRDILLSGTTQVGSEGIKFRPEGQHLGCFVGGMVGIGAKAFNRPDDMQIAKKLTEGCIWAYENTASGIMPEVFLAMPPAENDKKKKNKWDRSRWLAGVNDIHSMEDEDSIKDSKKRAEKIVEALRLPEGFTGIPDRRYILRPEAIESVFIMYRLTGDRAYQDAAWKMFEAIIKATETEESYASIPDVTVVDNARVDASESFWMAETLKYFYLIFSEPDLISLDEYVFNTEAHPFKQPREGVVVVG